MVGYAGFRVLSLESRLDLQRFIFVHFVKYNDIHVLRRQRVHASRYHYRIPLEADVVFGDVIVRSNEAHVFAEIGKFDSFISVQEPTCIC